MIIIKTEFIISMSYSEMLTFASTVADVKNIITKLAGKEEDKDTKEVLLIRVKQLNDLRNIFN